MKKLLLLTILSGAPLFAASSIYDSLEKFNAGEKSFKHMCFDFKKQCTKEKLDLMQRQHDECADLKSRCLAKLRTEGFSEGLLRDELAAKVALCERHLEEHKALCERHQRQELELYRQGKAQLDSFKNEFGGRGSAAGYSYKPAEHGGTFLETMLEKLRTSAGL